MDGYDQHPLYYTHVGAVSSTSGLSLCMHDPKNAANDSGQFVLTALYVGKKFGGSLRENMEMAD